MLYRIIILCSIIFISSCTLHHQKKDPNEVYREWNWQHTALEINWQIFHVADWMQTETILRNDRFIEANPLMRGMDKWETTAFFAVTSILHAFISYALPDPYRTWFQGITLGAKGSTVLFNAGIGIYFTPPWKL